MVIEYIKALKQERKITVKELSNLTNIPESTINNLLSGKTENPSFEVVSSLVTALGGSVDVMLGIAKIEANDDTKDTVAAIREIYEKQIAALIRDKRALFALSSVLILFFLFCFAADMFNGRVGWFQY